MCRLEELENELKELKSKCEEIRKNITQENVAEVLQYKEKYMVCGTIKKSTIQISLYLWYSIRSGGGTMLYIDYDSLGMEIVAETIPHGGLEPDMQANTFGMTEEVIEVLKSGSDSRLYSVMWDIYNDNNSCVAIQSFKNWMEEVNRTEAKRIQKAINRIEANEKALSRCF